MSGVYLAATVGPSNLWLFRWPLRMVEYLYLAAGVLFAVVLSAGLATDQVRRRSIATGAIVLAGTYLAWAVEPQGYNRIHLTGLALVAVLLTAGLTAYFRCGLSALGIVLVTGSACVVALQTTVFPHFSGADKPVYPGYDVAQFKTTTKDYRGTVLQLASRTGVTTEQMFTGEIMFGNLPLAAGLASVGNYTGLLGFAGFADALCMDYRGATCPDAFPRLWRPADHDTNVRLVDALGVSTLVLQRSLLPDVVDRTPPPGWHVAVENGVRTVWLRDRPLSSDGRVSWSSKVVQVFADSAQPQHEIVRYRSSGHAGRIIFTRLAWPGYTATVDGRPVEVSKGPAGLVAVEVPAGDHTLVLAFETPGLQLGFLALGAAAAIVALQSLFDAGFAVAAGNGRARMFWITLHLRRR
ncbi:MAG: YfhO family protein [Pseudonocardiales bacterium]|nr:YfhO family protein [Pseudonocardiales bacterium]